MAPSSLAHDASNPVRSLLEVLQESHQVRVKIVLDLNIGSAALAATLVVHWIHRLGFALHIFEEAGHVRSLLAHFLRLTLFVLL